MIPPVSFLAAFLSIALLQAADWPSWRGSEGHGTATEATPPAKCSPKENLLWKAPLPGRGCSTPIVWKDQIILTCDIDGKDGVLAFDMAGKELWRHSFGKTAGVRHQSPC